MTDKNEMTVENMWLEFLESTELGALSPEIIDKMKYIFYTGFKCMWEANNYYQLNTPTMEGYRIEMSLLGAECEQYSAKAMAEQGDGKPKLEIVKD